MTPTPLSPTTRWTVFTAAWATTAIAAGVAFLGPFLSLILERETGSGGFIGLFATVGALTTVALTPFGPWLMRRASAPRLVAIGVVGGTLCFALYPLAPGVAWWFPIRFLQGLFLTVVFIVGETWINSVAPEAKRGRILSVYAIFLAGGLGAGAALSALVIESVGLEGWVPYLVGAAIVATGLAPLSARAHAAMEPPSEEHGSPRAMGRILVRSPGLMASVFVFGAIEFSLFHMVPVYGVRLGFGEADAAMLLLALPLGSVLLTYPIGMAADRFDRRRVLGTLFALCAAVGAVLGVLDSYWAIMAALALFVGAAGGLYTVGLAILSERNRGGAIAAANSAFIFAYGLGSLASPAVIGAGMDAAGPGAMPLILAGACAVGGLVFAALERRQQQHRLDSPRAQTM